MARDRLAANMPLTTRRIEKVTSRKQTKAPAATPRFKLNRALNRPSLSKAFQEKGRLQIPAILRRADAQALYQCLSERTQWGLLLGSGPGIGQNYISPEHCEVFTAAQHRTLHRMVHPFRRQAGGGSHLMGVRLIGHDAFDRQTDPSLLARFVDWLNSRVFLNFVRDITGDCDIRCVIAQAMRFTVDHFSSFHADSTDPHRQRSTCVFSLSPTWHPSWGGLLQFANQRGKPEDEFLPCFNSAVIFKSSLRHGVSVVTRQALIPRYSIAAISLAQEGRRSHIPRLF
jgi:SM-20-related protein